MAIPESSDHQRGRQECPFVNRQNPICFCVNLNSQKIRLMSEYCMADYTECPYYPQLMKTYAAQGAVPDE